MAATGSSITVFLDFLNTTGISIFSGVNDIVNDAMRQTYMLKYFMAGKTAHELLQGGSTINDDIYLSPKLHPTAFSEPPAGALPTLRRMTKPVLAPQCLPARSESRDGPLVSRAKMPGRSPAPSSLSGIPVVVLPA